MTRATTPNVAVRRRVRPHAMEVLRRAVLKKARRKWLNKRQKVRPSTERFNGFLTDTLRTKGGRSQSVGPTGSNVDGSPKRQARSGSAIPGSAVAVSTKPPTKKTSNSTPSTIIERRPRPSKYSPNRIIAAKMSKIC